MEKGRNRKNATYFSTLTENSKMSSTVPDIRSTVTRYGNIINGRKLLTIQIKHADVSHILKHSINTNYFNASVND